MRFLVDENLSRQLPGLLRANGHEAEHIADLGLESASDPVILEYAREGNRILVLADTDFGTLLAESHARLPSIILIRANIQPASLSPRESDRGESGRPHRRPRVR